MVMKQSAENIGIKTSFAPGCRVWKEGNIRWKQDLIGKENCSAYCCFSVSWQDWQGAARWLMLIMCRTIWSGGRMTSLECLSISDRTPISDTANGRCRRKEFPRKHIRRRFLQSLIRRSLMRRRSYPIPKRRGWSIWYLRRSIMKVLRCGIQRLQALPIRPDRKYTACSSIRRLEKQTGISLWNWKMRVSRRGSILACIIRSLTGIILPRRWREILRRWHPGRRVPHILLIWKHS